MRPTSILKSKRPTKKLINEIRWLAPKAILVGFKLEPRVSLPALRKKGMNLARQADCDLVVANTLENPYRGYILNREGKILDSAESRAVLSRKLTNLLKDYQ